MWPLAVVLAGFLILLCALSFLLLIELLGWIIPLLLSISAGIVTYVLAFLFGASAPEAAIIAACVAGYVLYRIVKWTRSLLAAPDPDKPPKRWTYDHHSWVNRQGRYADRKSERR